MNQIARKRLVVGGVAGLLAGIFLSGVVMMVIASLHLGGNQGVEIWTGISFALFIGTPILGAVANSALMLERFFARHPRLATLVWRVIGPEVIVCYMHLSIQFDRSPHVQLGPEGRELACYVPDGIQWRQLNYGQGEGQVDIDGREWGFYWDGPTEMAVLLHDKAVDLEAAVDFVRRVAKKVAGRPDGFKTSIKADTRLLQRPAPPYGAVYFLTGQPIRGPHGNNQPST